MALTLGLLFLDSLLLLSSLLLLLHIALALFLLLRVGLALALDLLFLNSLLLLGGLLLLLHIALALFLLLRVGLALTLDLLLLDSLLLLCSLLLLLHIALTFLLFVPTTVARPGTRLVRGFDRAVQRFQLGGRGSGCAGLINTAAGSCCPSIHCVTLFTDYTNLLCGVVVAIRHGLSGGRLRRPSRIFLQLLFTRGKRTLTGRWRIAHEDLTVECFTRWTHPGDLTRADHAAHARRNRGNARDLASRDRLAVEANRCRSHRLRIHEHAAGYRGDGACNRAVGIVHLIDIDRAAGIVVINVGDGRVVDHRIVHVDPFEIVTAGLIGRYVDFARSKWEPADR